MGSDLEDHILILTIQGDVKSLRISEIVQVMPLSQQTCRVQFHLLLAGKETLRVVEIREGQQVFLKRCEHLLEAIRLKDEPSINRFFAPVLHTEEGHRDS